MVYTEVKEKNSKKYYYRVKSFRDVNKVRKKRIYLGANLSKKELSKMEKKADKELIFLDNFLDKKDLKILSKIKKEFQKESRITLQNRYESFCSLFAYDSTAIEGNTLTLQETAHLLFENQTPAKSLREINETLNHKNAFDYILKYKGNITKKFILDLHKMVIEKTLNEELSSQIGKYRNVQVYIRGVNWLPVKSVEVAREMKSLLFWYSNNKDKLHPLVVAAYFHVGFETIHPFVDGNGRVGRLLMNFILHKAGFPMINIPSSLKVKYYKTLEEAQVNGNLKPFASFLIDVLEKSKIKF